MKSTTGSNYNRSTVSAQGIARFGKPSSKDTQASRPQHNVARAPVDSRCGADSTALATTGIDISGADVRRAFRSTKGFTRGGAVDKKYAKQLLAWEPTTGQIKQNEKKDDSKSKRKDRRNAKAERIDELEENKLPRQQEMTMANSLDAQMVSKIARRSEKASGEETLRYALQQMSASQGMKRAKGIARKNERKEKEERGGYWE